MAYKDFVNDYKKGNIGSVLVFYGAEDFLMEWAINMIAEDNVDADYRNMDYRILDGETANAYDIMSEARSYSMFSASRVVVVRNYLPMIKKSADVGMDELAAFAKELSMSSGSSVDSLDSYRGSVGLDGLASSGSSGDSGIIGSSESDGNFGSSADSPSILIFVVESMNSGKLTSYGKQLIKSCRSYEFSRLDKADLSAFITKRVRAAGKMMASKELHHLMDVSGYFNRDSSYSLMQLDSDLAKLTGACEGDYIDYGLIDEIVMGDGDKFVFNLVDALTAGRRGRALEIAETIIKEADSSMAVLALLSKQFEIMYDAIELSERGMSMREMAGATGINEYRFKKAYTAAMSYSKDIIKSLLISLYNIDRDIKSGNIDKDTALELFVLRAAA